MVTDGQEMTSDHELEEKSAVPIAALYKVLAMLCDLSELVCRMESSQSAQVDQERKDSEESSVFNSALRAGAGVNLQSLEHTTPPNGRQTSRRLRTSVSDDQHLLGLWLTHQLR